MKDFIEVETGRGYPASIKVSSIVSFTVYDAENVNVHTISGPMTIKMTYEAFKKLLSEQLP